MHVLLTHWERISCWVVCDAHHPCGVGKEGTEWAGPTKRLLRGRTRGVLGPYVTRLRAARRELPGMAERVN